MAIALTAMPSNAVTAAFTDAEAMFFKLLAGGGREGQQNPFSNLNFM